MVDFIRIVVVVSIGLSVKQKESPTCGDIEKRNEENANPLRGDIIVLELLVIVGAVMVMMILGSFEVQSRKPRKTKGEERYVRITCTGIEFGVHGALSPFHWTCLYYRLYSMSPGPQYRRRVIRTTHMEPYDSRRVPTINRP